ncbi:hypothetical protein JOQ06_021794 [Pogonophryne albipinna]|uniref:Uncharacterized protein n=1 Tax=Pogonophryne albipinna TaxID=1090488 RepID=A0AAD6A5L0_9TELE|nr:hypothetical protein JOQ06_021794 [Pogonophryne albipinna]
MQPKAGGKLHLRLNTGTRPIVDKYLKGKLKRTLKREGVKPLRGKRVGSAQSARGIQLGWSGSATRCGRISSWDLSPVLAGPRRAHFLRGGALRPALGRPGKARGEGGSRLWPRALQRPPPGSRRFPGQWTKCSLRPLSPSGGGTGPPVPGATVNRVGLFSVRSDRVVPAKPEETLVEARSGPDVQIGRPTWV